MCWKDQSKIAMASILPSVQEDTSVGEKARTRAEVVFVPYEKMSEDTNPWPSRKLNSIKQWVAMEKVHGANFSFTAQLNNTENGGGTEKDRLVVKAAKRGGYLREGEYFFGVHRQDGLLVREKEKVKTLFLAAKEMFRSSLCVSAVTVYGELFGGFYPHPSVSHCPGVIPVQTEVVYCPDLKFMAYDIAILGQPTVSGDNRSYLDYDICIKLFKASGFLYAEPLITGSLQAILNYPIFFTTKLPAKLGLPELPKDTKENIAEGIVIKPMKTVVFDTLKGKRRVIFKMKIQGFMEKKQRNWQGKQKQTGVKESVARYNQEYELLRYEMLAMITTQRLVNVISKVGFPIAMGPQSEAERRKGERENKDASDEWQDIEEGLATDILEELTLEREKLWTSFQHQQPVLLDQILKELKQECVLTVQQYRDQQLQ